MSLKGMRSSFGAVNPSANEKVVINVGGIKHETYTDTLRNIPDTRLYWISENNTQLPEYDPNANEYFFDRHPTVFGQILNFYRTGKLHCPNDVCGPLFEEELAFWGIDELQVESCCWLNYKKHREAQANLDTIDGNDSDRDSLSDMDMTVYGLVADSIRNRNRTLWRKYQPKIWTTFEEPYSSRLAQVVAFTTLILILASVITFCLESVPYFQQKLSAQFQALRVTEIICVSWFTLEFVMRLTFCPRKLQFFKKPMNWIDFGAILPFYLELFIKETDIKTIVVLRVVRLIRVFRIFKLSRHSYGLQILGHTLKSSCSELFLLAFFLSIGVVIFSSIIYYAEKDLADTKFTTIPASFWWAVVTMTTLGYGDMSPKSWEGKIVGSFCAISGVLMIALPVPVIVSNFSLYYSHAKARLKLPKRKRPLIIGAANALRVAQSFATQNSPKFSKDGEDHIERDDLEDDTDKEDMRPHSRSRRSSRLSLRSTPRGSPTAKRKFSSSPTTVVTPPSPRNSLITPMQIKVRSSLLAVPEAERIEIEMEERTPPFAINMVEKENPPKSPEDNSSQESMHAGNNFASRCSVQNSDASSVTSPKKSDPESTGSASNEFQALAGGRQRSSSSAQSLSQDSTQGSPKLNPRGRMGRRGSLYVVGFTAKHWQNKALKKNKQKTQSAQTEPGSRRASGSMTESRGSNTQTATESNDRRNSGRVYDSSVLSSPSQIQSQLRGLKETEEITELPESEAAGLSRDGLLENSKGKLFKGTEEGNGKGTQTPSKFKNQSPENYRVKSVPSNPSKMREFYNPGKMMQTSISIESNDSSSKWSDDSLTVNDRHRQRRGSSPLIRQKAVFTFDMPEQFTQVDPTAGSLGHTVSLSPLMEHSSEHVDTIDSGLTKKMRAEGRRNSCLPAITTEKTSSKKDKSKSVPNGYINGSYHEDEEDRVMADRGQLPKTSHPGGQRLNTASNDADMSRTRSGSYPAFLSVGGEIYQSGGMAGQGQPYYTEAKSLGQYSKAPQRHASSISDSCLPSISEEQAVLDSRTRGFDMYRIVAPPVLPRPHSLPNWSGDMVRPVVMQRPFSDSVFLNQGGAYAFPVMHPSVSGVEHMSQSLSGNIGPPLGVQQVPSIPVTHRSRPDMRNNRGSFEGQRRISEGDLDGYITQRRQGPMLYVHVPQSDAYNGTGIEPSASGKHANGRSPSVKDNSRSKANSTERGTSPFVFQKTESFSSPDLHSLNSIDRDAFGAGRLDSNLSKSWYQSSEGRKKTRAFEDGSVNEKHAFVDHSNHPSSSSQELLARKLSAHSAPNSFVYNSEHVGDNSARARPVSVGHVDSAPLNALKNGVRSEVRTSNGSPKLERTDRQVIYNGHEVLQPRDSLNRPNSVPLFTNRQRARAIFVGDSGIESVGSTSVTSMTHSLEFEAEGGKDMRDSVTGSSNARIDIMNPIHETETEAPDVKQTDNARKAFVPQRTVMTSVKSSGSHLTDILSNPDLYESSLV